MEKSVWILRALFSACYQFELFRKAVDILANFEYNKNS